MELREFAHTFELLDCDRPSVVKAHADYLKLAAAGVSFDGGGGRKEGHVLTRYERGAKVACVQLGYQALLRLCRSAGLKKIEARAVFEGDHFDVSYGTSAAIIHKPLLARHEPTLGKPSFVYAVAAIDGETQFDVMSLADVERIAALSKSKKRDGTPFGPWVDHFTEMAKKTVVLRLLKMLPLSAETNALIDTDDDIELRGRPGIGAGTAQRVDFRPSAVKAKLMAAPPAAPKSQPRIPDVVVENVPTASGDELFAALPEPVRKLLEIGDFESAQDHARKIYKSLPANEQSAVAAYFQGAA